MSYSLNEVEATAKRAARGAGYSWGLAEEAAKATRWLCANGLDGVAVLTGLLDRQLATSAGHAPKGWEGTWQCDDVLCPLSAGAYLSDCALQLRGRTIRMRQVAAPLVVLPFAANVARLQKSCVSVEIDGQVAVTDGSVLSGASRFPEFANELTMRTGGSFSECLRHRTRATPDPDNWTRLNGYAHRTYAPASDESRCRRAGAGLSDND